MTLLPKIKGLARKKPVCYDPKKDRFITLDDLDANKAQIVPLDILTDEQLKRLVIERNRVGEDYKLETNWKEPAKSPNDIIKQIEDDTELGRVTVEADINYLRNRLLIDIEVELAKSRRER
ncbi:MAG TPA: hypothetical protein DIU00_16275 [Phycisphaerales bacterium]|nr:hypothetical protein [Phycisphaerales bacterium]